MMHSRNLYIILYRLRECIINSSFINAIKLRTFLLCIWYHVDCGRRCKYIWPNAKVSNDCEHHRIPRDLGDDNFINVAAPSKYVAELSKLKELVNLNVVREIVYRKSENAA